MSFYARRCSAAISLALTLGAAPMAVYAQVGYDFNLPAQSLADSLREVGRRAHVNIVFDPASVRGQNAHALKGTYSAQQAMERLLAGTGLVLRRTQGGSFLVDRAGAASPKAGAGGTSEDDKEVDSGTTLDTVLVTAKVQGFAATRVPTELKEIPQSVSVISQETLQQQNAHDLFAAFNWATGITLSKSSATGTSYSARGFDVDSYHVDGGARLGLSGYSDLTEYDHIEVLRGSDALFGGVGFPGATVNLVRKKPQAEFAASTGISLGSWNNYRVEGDVTGPLDAGGALRGRLVVAHDDQQYFYDVARRKLTKFYGTLDYDLGPATRLTAGVSVEDQNSIPADWGLPRYSTGADPHLPRSTALAFPWGRNTSSRTEAFVQLEQRFGENWKLNVNGTRLDGDQYSRDGFIRGAINPVTGLMNGMPAAQESPQALVATNAFDATLTGSFDWHGRQQDIVFGVDYSRSSSSAETRSANVSGPRVNPFDFDPSSYLYVAPGPATSILVKTGVTIRASGAYAALKLRPWDDWSFNIGVRDNFLRSKASTSLFFGPLPLLSANSNNADTGKMTPYAGVTYDLTPQYTLYASYADVFSSNGGSFTTTGRPLSPRSGTTVEGGLKAAWQEGRLNGSIALYHTKLDNVSFQDPNAPIAVIPPGWGYIVGTDKSKGVDFELSGLAAPGWQFTTGYSFNINRNYAGVALSTRTPKHLLKLWTNYRLTGAWNDWDVGGGLTAQTGNYIKGTACPAVGLLGQCLAAAVPYRITQGFYTVATVRVGYRISSSWQAALSLNNVFDRHYYQTVGSINSGSWYGEPRNVMLTIRGSM